MFVRVWTAGIALLLALIFGRLVGPSTFGAVALALFAAKMSPALSGGSAYGLIKAKLGNDNENLTVRGFLTIYQLHLLIATILISLALGANALLLSIALVPVVSLDPVEKLDERLHYGMLPDVVCYSSSILVIAVLGEVDYLACAIVALAISFTLNLHSRSRLRRTEGNVPGLLPLAQYIGMIKGGFWLQITALLIALLLGMDRYFLSHYWEAALLGVFMLAYQFAQASTFPVQTMTQVYLLRYKKLASDGVRGMAAARSIVLENRLFSVIAVCAPVIAFSAALIYSHYSSPGFAELPKYTGVLMAGAIVWAICLALVPPFFYAGRMQHLVYPMFALILVNLMAHLLVIRLDGGFVIVPIAQFVMLCVTLSALIAGRRHMHQHESRVSP